MTVFLLGYIVGMLMVFVQSYIVPFVSRLAHRWFS